MDEEKQQEIMFKLQMFQQHAEQIQQQLGAIEEGLKEMNVLNSGLDGLVGKKGQKIKAHIGRGMFVDAQLLSEELIVDVGGKKFVKKKIPEAKEIIAEQIKKLDEVKRELQNNLERLGEEMQREIESVEGKE